MIRQIVDARVLLTATVPPTLPGSRMLGGSLAPPLAALMVFSDQPVGTSPAGRWPRRSPTVAGDRGGDDVGRLAGAGEPAIARAQPQLPLTGDVSEQLGLGVLP